jgi:hypothetical protein
MPSSDMRRRCYKDAFTYLEKEKVKRSAQEYNVVPYSSFREARRTSERRNITMFGSSIIDIAIGLVFVFLLLSLLASTINEIILSFLNMRAKELLRGLKTLLDDVDATGLVTKVYNHGQIFGLFEGQFDPKKGGNLPSYIPPQNFVMAFLDVVSAPQQQNQQPADASKISVSLKEGAQALAKDTKTEKVGKPLLAMIEAAGDDAAKLKKSAEDWYNSAMDRVSGWYKYRTQWILFGIGLVLAFVMNADTIRILKQLSLDSTLRQSIVAAAQSAKQPDNKSGLPIQDQIKQAQDQVSKTDNLGLGLGWDKASWQWSSLIGWLLTAIAVSLGAPFWFDILNKIMVVRSTVKPREKSHEEESKDKK